MSHTEDRRPGVTKVRVLPTRLPAEVRPRLARLARRTNEVCRAAGARLQAEVGLALEVALVDLAGAELRERNMVERMRSAEHELGLATARMRELELSTRTLAQRWQTAENELEFSRARVRELELYIFDEAPRDFMDEPQTLVRDGVPVGEFSSTDPTAVRSHPELVARCQTGERITP